MSDSDDEDESIVEAPLIDELIVSSMSYRYGDGQMGDAVWRWLMGMEMDGDG